MIPVKIILDLVSTCAWPIVKCLFNLWLYLPTYRGALFLHSLGQPHIEKNYGLISKVAGKYLAFVGIVDRASGEGQQENKKTQ